LKKTRQLKILVKKVSIYLIILLFIYLKININWLLIGLKKLEKYFPKNMQWKNFKPYLYSIILNPRQKFVIIEKLNFKENIRRDIQQAFVRECYK